MSHSDCIFCKLPQMNMDDKFFIQYEHCYVVKDAFPVSEGHLLIIANDHIKDWFSATDELRHEMLEVVDKMKIFLDEQYNPQGYNIGINCGQAAGQTIMHLHLHLIPRYSGDIQNPEGGVRGVIPSKQKY